MKVTLKHILITGIVLVGLIAGNVYQLQNPKVIETPAGQTEIDSTAWVQRSSYADRGMIIDSLEARNDKMANRIKEQGDQIASYTSITGRLKTQVDSLEQQINWNVVSLAEGLETIDSLSADPSENDSSQVIERAFTKTKTFGDGLFQVRGRVDVQLNPCGFSVEQLQMGLECPNNFLFRVYQDFELNQLRDIRLDITSTINDDQSRALVYVTSKDFESLEYQTYTELGRQNELPRFWLGVGSTLAVVLGGIIVLN